MSVRLTLTERDEAISVLKQHLTCEQMREVIDREVEKLVARTEHVKGRYSSRIADEHLAGFLIDQAGPDLLKERLMRRLLVESLDIDQIDTLASWGGDPLPSSKHERINHIVTRQWNPGKRWPLYFASFFGFPKIFAGLVGSPNEPATEEVEPYIHLPDLHTYQRDLLTQLQKVLHISSEAKRALLSLPTGAGKTRTAVEAVLTWWNTGEHIKPYILWIAHSEELCEQAVEAFREVWVDRGGDGVRKILGIYRYWGEYKALPDEYAAGVIVASIQKLRESIRSDAGKEILRNIAEDTAVIIIDEAHRATESSYTAVLEAAGFGFGHSPYSPVPLVGLTATPYRGSSEEENQKLVRRFNGNLLIPEELGDDPLHTLRKKGILSHVDHQILETSLKFEMTGDEERQFQQLRDLPGSFLTKIGQNAERNNLLLQKLAELPEDWPILCFGCSVKHATALAVLLCRRGQRAAVITGETRRATRRYFIEEFRRGHIQVLCNYGVLTTGFDAPKIRAIIIARPTTSVVLYEQMIGRGMRGPLNGGTERCLVVDLADHIVRFQGQMTYKRMEEFWQRRSAFN